MNRPVQIVRPRATPAVAPVTRAIRFALAASAALALSTPLIGIAADPCTQPALSADAQACRAGFRQAMADANDLAPVDLTVVADSPSPTSVIALHGAHAATVDVTSFAEAGWSLDGIVASVDADHVDDLTQVGNGTAFDQAFIAFAQRGDIGFAPALDNALDLTVEGDGNVIGLELHDPTALAFYNTGAITAIAHPDAYGAARATGVFAMSADVFVANDGDIDAFADADGGYARARAVETFGYGTGSTVENSGGIEAGAIADDGTARAFGIYSFAYGSTSLVDNSGDVLATAQAAGGRAYATAVNSIGYGGDAIVDNTGSLTAQAAGDQAYAFGVMNLATRQSASAQVTNDGTIDAQADGTYATATGIVNAMFRYGGASVGNSGDIAATANGIAGASATGIYNYAYMADAIVDNDGGIASHATATAGPALATGLYNHGGGYAATTSAGSIDASAITDAGFAGAWGLINLAGDTTYIVNDGDITVAAQSADGEALAAGIYARAGVLASVSNLGSVSATAGTGDGTAAAYGALVYAGFTGIGVLVNGGDLAATATVAGVGDAVAIGGYVIAEVASVFNDGSASASANTADGTATARGITAYGAYSAIFNYGDIAATANADAGDAVAVGADTWGYLGGSFANAGDILAEASAAGGTANAIGASTIGYIFGAYSDNAGAITAHAEGEYAAATGVVNAAAYLGTATTTNDGSIVAVAEGVMDAVAVGAYNFAYLYDSVIDNRGTIDATAITTYYQAAAVGAHAVGVYGSYGDVQVLNSGSIDAVAATLDVPGFSSASAWGVVTQNGPGGLSQVSNDGSITATAYATADFSFTYATGAYAQSIAGFASIVNHGDIGALSEIASGRGYAYSTGAQVLALYYGSEAAFENTGSITGQAITYSGFAVATGVAGYGYHAVVSNAAGADVNAIAYTDLFGSAGAIGIDAGAKYELAVVNDGIVTAYAHSAHGFNDPATGYTHFSVAGATGIQAYGGTFFTPGDASVVNHGDVTAIAVSEDGITFFNAGAGASGIRVNATRDALIDNSGNVTAIADSELGVAGAYGVVANGRHDSTIINQAGGVILASATVGTIASDYYAGRTAAMGAEVFGAQHGYIYNAGSITAQTVITPDGGANPGHSIAVAFGIEMRTHDTGDVVNVGDVHAFASADFGYASAYGVRLAGNQFQTYSNNSLATITNTGLITARADAANGNAFAVGAYAYAVRDEYLGCDYSGCHYDIVGGETVIDNAGDIHAVANAEGGIGASHGIVAIAAYATAITNSGDVSATTHADDALAVGMLAGSLYADATVTNSGQVVAAAYGSDATAMGVSLLSDGTNSLVNSGTIAALGDGVRIAVSSSADATATLANHGTLVGAIVTGNLADTLDNGAGALWHAVGESDFGTGADAITSAGTILLDDATIRLGAAGEGDSFANTGLILVSGSGNAIELPGGTFHNDGVISFLDGVADDRLAILGDFAGDGAIHLDVSGLTQASDRLYLDGDVVGSQVLDVNLLTAPTSASTLIPLVFVDGDSSADSFALGNVAHATNGFLTLDFNLHASIDAANATADVFSLGMNVTGLNGAGALAAVLAPGVQGVVNAQVGSWRQRMGVAPGARDGVLEPWLRVFSDSGDTTPTHAGNFGAGGNLGYHQSNRGWELGLDTRLSGNLALGMLIASSEGSQQLDAGAGRADLDARTVGLYGTWTVDSFYLDVSQRWIGVDARLESSAGLQRTEANAHAFSVEAGYTAWTVGGVHVVPQLQYTHSRVVDIEDLQGGSSTFVDEGGLSSRVRLGVAFDRTFDAAGYAWTPYGTLNVVRELDGDYDHEINGGLQGTTSTDGTSAQVELGLEARKGRFSVTGSVNRIDGGALDGITGGQLTVRYRW